MKTYELLEVSTTLFIGYIMLLVFLSLNRYLIRSNKLKKIEFTQRIIDENKDIPLIVNKIFAEYATSNLYPEDELVDVKREEELVEKAYKLHKFFNTLADGIDRGIYDEDLVRINFEQDIKFFYRYSGPYLRQLRFFVNSDEMFLPIEFLLKKWETKKVQKKVTFFG